MPLLRLAQHVSSLRRWLRHAWLGYAARDFFASQAATRPPRPPRSPLELERLEERAVFNDPIGMATVPLAGFGVLAAGTLLSPGEVILRGWYALNPPAAPPPAPTPPAAPPAPLHTTDSTAVFTAWSPGQGSPGPADRSNPWTTTTPPTPEERPAAGTVEWTLATALASDDGWLQEMQDGLDLGARPHLGSKSGRGLPSLTDWTDSASAATSGSGGSFSDGGAARVGSWSASDTVARGSAETDPYAYSGLFGGYGMSGSTTALDAGSSTGTTNSGGVVPRVGAGENIPPTPPPPTVVSPNFGKVPMFFEANAGQTAAAARFLARANGYTVFLTPDQIVFALNATRPATAADSDRARAAGAAATPDSAASAPGVPALGDPIRDVLQLHFVGANPNTPLQGSNLLTSRSNYFLGADRSHDLTNIANYGQVVAQGLYDGIDVVYQANGNALQFDLHAHAGADLEQITLRYDGAEQLSVTESGQLLLKTRTGELVQHAPLLYQTDAAGKRQHIDGRYVSKGDNQFGFAVANYDRSRTLVLDPTATFSTYLGGGGNDYGNAIAVDAQGSAYVTGQAGSVFWGNSFPTSAPYDNTLAGDVDLFVTKMAPDGASLLYSTFIGGATGSYSTLETANGIAVDQAGNAYVVGHTDSTSYPTVAAYQSSFGGGGSDLVVTKINAAGDALVYSTYLGSSGIEYGYAIAVDGSGAAYVTGNSTNGFPTTSGAAQTSHSSIHPDAIISKLDPSGGSLVYSSYLGGDNSIEQGYGITVDATGHAVVVGYTYADDFPTVNAADGTNVLSNKDAFITRVAADGSAWEFSTYLGGDYTEEEARGVAVDADGNVYVVGTTTSSLGTGGAYQTTLSGTRDAFVAKYTPSGSRLSTSLLGGSGSEYGYAIAVDAAGQAHIAGKTDSSNFPTVNPFQGSLAGFFGSDAFYATFDSTAATLLYSTYVGGSNNDWAQGIALDLEGNAYLTGTTESSNFPTSLNAFQGSNGGGFFSGPDAFVTRLERLPPPVITSITTDSGYLASDFLTNDQTLLLGGTAVASSTVSLYRAGVGFLGTTTANSSGVWSYDYTGTALPEGVHAFTATAGVGGYTSRVSAPRQVTVDLTPPEVTLELDELVAGVVYDSTPWVYTSATDFYGLPPNAAVTLDVDLNDDGDYLDTDEADYQVEDLFAFFELVPALTVGSYQLRARVTDKAGNEGYTTLDFDVGVADWLDDATRTVDALRGDGLLQVGNLQVTHTLDLDLSPGTWVGQSPFLSYNSERVDVRPIVSALLQTEADVLLPDTITVQLTFAGTPQTPQVYDTVGFHPGDQMLMAQQAATALTDSGRYRYHLDVTLDYPTPVTYTLDGHLFVAVEDESPYGPGWTLGGVDRLVEIAADDDLPAGYLRIYGSKHVAFYAFNGSGYDLPPGDGGEFDGSTYTGPDGWTRTFDGAGNQTGVASPDGSWRSTYTWDSGLLVGLANSDGSLTTFTYASGQLQTIVTGPRTVTLTHDGDTLTRITNPDGGVHTFMYAANDKLTSNRFGVLRTDYEYEPERGVLTEWTPQDGDTYTLDLLILKGLDELYAGPLWNELDKGGGRPESWRLDLEGRPLQRRVGDGGLTRWDRDPTTHSVTAVTDPLGRVTSYVLDEADYVEQVTWADGSTRSYEYDITHGLTLFVDERGYATTSSYSSGLLQFVEDATEATTNFTWSSGLLQRTEDALGNVTTQLYDGARRLQTILDALNGRVTLTYDSNGNLATRTDPLGRVTTYTNDPLGRVLRSDDPLGMLGSWVYDPSGLLLGATNAAGTRTTKMLDGRGLPTQTTLGVGTSAQRSVLGVYDGGGLSIQNRDARGYSSSQEYDPVGRVRQSVDEAGNPWQYHYDLAGQLLASTDPLAGTQSRSYDSRGRVTRLIDPQGGVTTQIWDPASNLVGTIDPAGVRTSLVYDAVNRLVARTDGVGSANPRTTTWVYDAVGAVVDIITPGGSHTEYSYDALQRVLAVREAAGSADESETQYAWTAAGGLEQITAADGEITWNVLDARNRVLEQYSGYGTADEQSTTYDYQNAGWVTQITDALGQITTFDYNPFGEEIARTVAVGTGVEQTTTTLRDAAGAVTGTVVAGQAAWQTAYDALGQPIVQIDPLGNRTQAYYDAVGNRTGVKDGRGQTSSTSYDQAGRPLTFTDALGQVTEQQYDARGRVVVVINARGYRTSYTYDSHDALIQIEDARNGLFTNLYDSSGRLETTLDALGRRTTTVYDSLNRVIAQIDALGQRTSTIYNAGGNIEATIDAAGRRTTYLYDSLRRQVGTIDALGNRTTQVLDAAGNVTVLINALNQRTTQVYDDRNRLQVTIDALNNRTTQVWDDLDRVVAVVDARGQRTSYLYDVAGRLTGTVDAQGQTTTRRYDANGNLLTVTDTLGNTTTTAYDALNRAYQTTDALGSHSTVVYDPMSNVVVAIDALGRRTSVVFDALDRAEVTIDALTNRTTAVYDAVGNQLAVINARGYRTSTVYDALNRAEVTVNALGNRTTTGYDAVSNVSAVVDALNGRTTYTYDALHRLTATTNALNQTVSQTYDAVSNVVQSTNGRGFVTTSSYDALQRLVQVEDELNGLFTQLYDAVGNATVSINARGFRTTSVYDSLNRLQSRTDALNHTITLLYDVKSRVTGQIDALGQRTTTTYDALDRVVAVKDAGGGVATRVYDAVGNLVNAIDAVGHKTTYLYDVRNRQTEIRDAQGGIVSLLYDSIGNNTAVVDPVGNRTSMVYDALNRLVENIDPRNKSVTMAYDALNRLISSTDRLGQRRDYSFNAISQQTGEVWKDVGGSTVNTLTFTWDANGNRTLAADKNGAYTTTYDALDRATIVQGPFGLTLTQAYDAVGNRTQVEDSKGGVTTSIYNAVNLLTQRQFGGVGQTPLRFDQTYTARDELSGVTRYSDLAGTTLVGTSSYVYDNVGNTTSIVHKDGSGTTLLALTYTYDLAHRLSTDNVDGALHTYTYDNTNQLTGDGTDTFAFDLNGNPTGGGFTVTTGNLLTSDGTWTYTNNDAGQRTKKSLGASAETWTYSYDTRGQMDSAEQRATDGGTLLLKLVFTYDVDGRLIAQERWTSGSGTLTTRYGYDTTSNNVWVDLDGSNALLTRDLRPDGMDALAARISAAGTASWHLTERQGTVLGNTNAAGALANKNVYNSYGKLVSQSNAAASDAYGYTGKVYQADLQFSYHWHRWYDTLSRRWTTFDPIGFQAGDFNLQRYVGNGPTNGTDPTGLWQSMVLKPLTAKIAEHVPSLAVPAKLLGATAHHLDLGPQIGASLQNLPERVENRVQSKMNELAPLNGGALPPGLQSVSLRESTQSHLRNFVLTTELLSLLPSIAGVGATLNETTANHAGGMDWLDALALAITKNAPGTGMLWRAFESSSGYEISRGVLQPLDEDERIDRGGAALAEGGMLLFGYMVESGVPTRTGGRSRLQFNEAAQGQLADLPKSDLLQGSPPGPVVEGELGGLSRNPTKPVLEKPPHFTVPNRGMINLRSLIDRFLALVDTQSSCFVAGTPLLTPDGSKAIEQFRPGDWVLSRSENDVAGAVEAKEVINTFVRVGLVIELHVDGRRIKTTREHPFWVKDRGWVAAGLLEVGDLLCSHDGTLQRLERIGDQDEVTTVYNLHVADHHTYFVGCDEWGFSVWAHNVACGESVRLALEAEGVSIPKGDPRLDAIAKHINEGDLGRARNAIKDLPGGNKPGKTISKIIDAADNPPGTGGPALPPTQRPPRPQSPAREMARHAVEDSNRWDPRIDQLMRERGLTRQAATQQAITEAEALIHDVRNAPNVQQYTARDGQTIYLRRGDDAIVIENPSRSEGSVFRRSSPEAAKDYFDRFKMDNPGGE